MVRRKELGNKGGLTDIQMWGHLPGRVGESFQIRKLVGSLQSTTPEGG